MRLLGQGLWRGASSARAPQFCTAGNPRAHLPPNVPQAARASLRGASADAAASALIRHNLVVFSDGLNGMQVLCVGPRHAYHITVRPGWQCALHYQLYQQRLRAACSPAARPPAHPHNSLPFTTHITHMHRHIAACTALPGQVLPPLVDAVPEARLNLVVFYLRRGDPGRAMNLIRALQPATAFEHICKASDCPWAGQGLRLAGAGAERGVAGPGWDGWEQAAAGRLGRTYAAESCNQLLAACPLTGALPTRALGRRAWSARCAPSRTGPAAWRQRPSAASRQWAPPRQSATPSQVLGVVPPAASLLLVNLALTAAHSHRGCALAAWHCRSGRQGAAAQAKARKFTGRHDMPTTPAGRQCMASSLMLQGRHAEALPYLDSIGEYCSGDDAYHWNLGMARGAAGAQGAGGGAGVGGLAQAESRGMGECHSCEPV